MSYFIMILGTSSKFKFIKNMFCNMEAKWRDYLVFFEKNLLMKAAV